MHTPSCGSRVPRGTKTLFIRKGCGRGGENPSKEPWLYGSRRGQEAEPPPPPRPAAPAAPGGGGTLSQRLGGGRFVYLPEELEAWCSLTRRQLLFC